MTRRIIILCIAVLTAIPSWSQNVQEQRERKKQLEEEIALIDKQLSTTSKKRKQSLNTLILTRQKLEARKKLIDRLDSDIAGYDSSISSTNAEIARLNERLDTLRKYHADLVRGAYKTRDNKVWFMYILSSKDMSGSRPWPSRARNSTCSWRMPAWRS